MRSKTRGHHIPLTVVFKYNHMFIHDEIYNNHIHIANVTNNYVHIPDVTNNHIHISDVTNSHIYIPDVIKNHIHIPDVTNNHIHIPDVIYNHIHIPDVTNIYSCVLLIDQVKIKTSNFCAKRTSIKIITMLPFDHLHFNPIPSSNVLNNNNTPLRSTPAQPSPFL